MSNFKTIDNVVDYLEEIAPLKFDTVLPLSELKARPVDGKIGLHVPQSPIERLYRGNTTFPVSRAAFRNLFGRANAASGWKFMRDLISPNFPEEGCALINRMLEHEKFNSGKRGPKQVMVRSRGGVDSIEGDSTVHRALFSNQYKVLDMLDVAKIVKQYTDQFAAMGNTDQLMEHMKNQYGIDVTVQGINGSGISHSLDRVFVTPDEMSLRLKLGITFHTEEMGDFNTGLFIGTDEIGKRSVHLLSYIWRQICANGMVASFERKEITDMRRNQGWTPIIYHRWSDTADLIYQAHKAVSYALASGSELVVKAREAAYRELPNASDVLTQMLTSLLPKEHLNAGLLQAGSGMEGEKTVMGLVNGITSVAHVENLSQGTIDEVEALGGSALRRYDAEMSDKDITNLFLGLAKVELIQQEDV